MKPSQTISLGIRVGILSIVLWLPMGCSGDSPESDRNTEALGRKMPLFDQWILDIRNRQAAIRDFLKSTTPRDTVYYRSHYGTDPDGPAPDSLRGPAEAELGQLEREEGVLRRDKDEWHKTWRKVHGADAPSTGEAARDDGPSEAEAVASDGNAEPEWKRGIRAKLRRKVGMELVDAPPTEVIAYLQTFAKVSMVVDPKAMAVVRSSVTLRVTNMPVDLALSWVLELAGLDWTLRNGAVFVSTPERVAALEPVRAPVDPALHGAIGKQFNRKVTFEFVDTPVGEAIQFIQTLTRCTIAADPEADTSKPVTVRINDQQLSNVFREMLKQAGLAYVVRDGAVYVSTPDRLSRGAPAPRPGTRQ